MTRVEAAVRRAIARPAFRALEFQRRLYGCSEQEWLKKPRHLRRLQALAAFVGLTEKEKKLV